MRAAWGLTVALLGAAASAQTRVDADATAGVAAATGSPATFGAEGALRLEGSRGIGDVSVFATFSGLLTVNPGFRFTDLGSEVGAAAKLGGSGLSVRLDIFPLNGSRVREAFDWANMWGRPLPTLNASTFVGPTVNFAPTARLMLLHERFDLWAALSGYPIAGFRQEDTVGWSGKGGVAVRGPVGLTLELRGGAHYRGKSPMAQFMPMVATPSILAVGGTGRLSWSWGGGVSPQVDLLTYADDPERFERFFSPDAYESLVAAWVGVEGGVVSQNLQPFKQGMEATRTVTGYADGQARLRFGPARFFLTGRYQPAQFLQFDAPGLPSFIELDPDTTQPRLAVLAGADVRLDDANVELGIQGRAVLPALVRPCASPTGACTTNSVLLALNDTEPFSGGQRTPIFGALATVRWAPMRALTIVTTFAYERDSNSGTVDPLSGAFAPALRETMRLLLYAQARF